MAEPEKKPVLVIDDDRKLCGLIRDYLEPLGFSITARHDGPDGLAEVEAEEYDAVILDVMMPGMDGFEVLKNIRQKSDVPILMLTAMGEEPDRIVGLEMGADDYLPKTFSTRELLARLRAVMRRSRTGKTSQSDLPPDLEAGELHLNEATHTVALGDQPLDLTAIEFALLASLLRAKGRVKSREQLMEEVAEREFEVFDRSIDVHISAVRKKLNDDPKAPRFIRTIRGVGYQLINPEWERTS
ncbi:MAG: response regulator transcription factor [Verrucomicrobiota bacterium]